MEVRSALELRIGGERVGIIDIVCEAEIVEGGIVISDPVVPKGQLNYSTLDEKVSQCFLARKDITKAIKVAVMRDARSRFADLAEERNFPPPNAAEIGIWKAYQAKAVGPDVEPDELEAYTNREAK